MEVLDLKKIYSKMTKERAQAYQIETSIYLRDDGSKSVRKTALGTQAEPHINRMIDYYENNKSKGVLVSARRIKSGCAEFDFVNGTTLYENIIFAVQNKSIEDLKKCLNSYKKILLKIYPEENFLNIEKNVNVDISFDNIVMKDDNYVVIDYEWVFDDLYTVGFAIYRAVTALYAHDGHLINEIMTIDEMFAYFGVLDQKSMFEIQNQEFNESIFGKQSYNKILRSYRKSNFDVSHIISKSDAFTQIYFDYGNGYSEENSIQYEIQNDQVKFDLAVEEGIKGIRVDLCNFPFVARGIKIIAKSETEEKEITGYLHNSILLDDRYNWFWNDDPQIILTSNIVDLSQTNLICVLVEKIDIVQDQEALKISQLLGELITEKVQKNNEDFAKTIEEITKKYHSNLDEQNRIIDNKEQMCEQYRNLANALIDRLNKVNSDYRICEYRSRGN